MRHGVLILVIQFISLLSLAACGGGGGSSSATTAPPATVATLNSLLDTIAVESRACTAAAPCVGPAAVFFDASLPDSPAAHGLFRNIQYTWDFGDGAHNAAWTNGTHTGATCDSTSNGPGCKNYATGAVAAHVYEHPGTFSPTLTVFDGTNSRTFTLPPVTVSDPNTVFSGTNTTCVAASSLPVAGSGGCPAGASVINLSTLADPSFQGAMTAALANGKRILFKVGDTFTATAGENVTTVGPGIIGSYGGGQAAILMTDASDYSKVLTFGAAPDWRVLDLSFDSTAPDITKQTAIGAGTETTVLRATFKHFTDAVGVNGGADLAIQDSSITDAHYGPSGAFGSYFAGTHLMLLGNRYAINVSGSSGVSYNLRANPAVGFVVANNSIVAGGPSLGGLTFRGGSVYGEVADNDILNNGISVKAGSSTAVDDNHDIVFERNFFHAAELGIETGRYLTARNNLFDLSGFTTGGSGRALDVRWVPTTSPEPADNLFVNNTVYDADATCCLSMVTLQSSLDAASSVTIRNNAGYFPNATSYYTITNAGACQVTAGDNSTAAQLKQSDPLWSGAGSYAGAADFTPTAGSYLIGGGSADVPVWTDFFGKARPGSGQGAFDLGAVRH